MRKMLEHKGALTIDADQLAHAAYAKGTSGFNALVQHFGNEILQDNGQIDRKRLGSLVFKNSGALIELESIIHPLVSQAIERVIGISPLPIIVIEAIKLLESDLHNQCDVIWAVTSKHEDIYQRLGETRKMSRASVDERLGNQFNEQIDKSPIDTTILNQGDISDLWANISEKWEDLSIKSGSFGAALTNTNELMKPFQSFLIQPNNAIITQTISEINKRGLFFLPAKNFGSGDSNNFGEDLNSADLRKNLFQYFFWKSEGKPEDALFLISDMDNFIATSASSISRFDPAEFIKVLGMVEEFSNLHLCEELYLSF